MWYLRRDKPRRKPFSCCGDDEGFGGREGQQLSTGACRVAQQAVRWPAPNQDNVGGLALSSQEEAHATGARRPSRARRRRALARSPGVKSGERVVRRNASRTASR